MTKFNLDLKELLDSLDCLSIGRLPPSLIPMTTMTSALTSLEKALMEHRPNLQVVDVPPEYYYSTRVHAYWGNGSDLFIAVPIPISGEESVYSVYRSAKFPVPIDTSRVESRGTTIITNTPTYLAVSKSHLHYLQLTDFEFSMCKQGPVRECKLPLPRLTPSKPTCILALFLDVPVAIHQTCKFKIDLLAPIPHMSHPISSNEFLLSTDISPSRLDCPNTPTLTLHNVAWSVITVPCKCSLTNSFTTMSNTNLSCVEDAGISSIMQCAVNLPVWTHFGNPPANVSGISLSTFPFEHPLPNLERSRLRHLQRDLSLVNSARDLEEAANQLRRDTPSSISLSNALDAVDMKTSSPVFELLTLLVAFIALVVGTINHVKVTRLIIALNTIGKASAMDYGKWKDAIKEENQEWWKNKAHRTTPGPNQWEFTHTPGRYDYFAILTITGAALYILYRAVKCWFPKTPCNSTTGHRNPHIAVKIHHGWRTVVLEALPLDFDLNTLQVVGYAPELHSWRLTLPLGRTLFMEWADGICIKVGPKTFMKTLPNKLPVPVKDRWTVWKAVTSMDPRISLVLVDGGRHFQILPDLRTTTERSRPGIHPLTPPTTNRGIFEEPIGLEIDQQPSGPSSYALRASDFTTFNYTPTPTPRHKRATSSTMGANTRPTPDSDATMDENESIA